ncbi:MAG: helix-turn-helix transcriptional regulator [Plectolyngbya sp. WJT66-NPBG17]|jgi:transcriptional regulator with XRE-family HTH domain|nr:helix-turn-helix transcriptional regulator [Plectolyngbya sp. WJT66-NPBG17]MBW4524581.1 helix-turn-helix transcriptional regulator [Phormidium tanganyikae FI6-MK23]
MNPLKLSSEECSAFGRLVLQYLEENPQTNMSQLAREVDISRAGLGWICRKRSNPDEETATKVARSIRADLTEVARLVHENKLEKLAHSNRLMYATKFGKDSVQIAIPLKDAIAGLNALFQAFHIVTQSVPEIEKPTDFQIYKQAYEIVKRQFLSRKIPRKQHEPRHEPSQS